MCRFVFDGTPLLGPRTGVGWYTHDLVDAVARQAPADEVVVVPISWRQGRRRPVDVPHRPNVSVRSRRLPPQALWALWRRVPFPPAEWLVDGDVFHGTNFVAPPSRRMPTVVTVHDLGFVRHPAWATRTAGRMARLLPAVLRRADAVVTVSEFTRQELASWLPEVEDRITVIPNGGHLRHTAASTGGLPPGPPYAVVLGTLEPRKNVTLALDAMRIVADRHVELRLVLAGGPSPLVDVDALLRERRFGPDRVVRTGYVDDARAAALLAGARLLAYPSLYEGFGMPLVEAMDAGLPVVAARAGATPEVVGDAAVLVDPTPEAFADAMARVATDEALRARLVADGHRRARQFSWEKAASGCLALYRQLAGGEGGGRGTSR